MLADDDCASLGFTKNSLYEKANRKLSFEQSYHNDGQSTHVSSFESDHQEAASTCSHDELSSLNLKKPLHQNEN